MADEKDTRLEFLEAYMEATEKLYDCKFRFDRPTLLSLLFIAVRGLVRLGVTQIELNNTIEQFKDVPMGSELEKQ